MSLDAQCPLVCLHKYHDYLLLYWLQCCPSVKLMVWVVLLTTSRVDHRSTSAYILLSSLSLSPSFPFSSLSLPPPPFPPSFSAPFDNWAVVDVVDRCGSDEQLDYSCICCWWWSPALWWRSRHVDGRRMASIRPTYGQYCVCSADRVSYGKYLICCLPAASDHYVHIYTRIYNSLILAWLHDRCQ